jgi:hypothetical protein
MRPVRIGPPGQERDQILVHAILPADNRQIDNLLERETMNEILKVSVRHSHHLQMHIRVLVLDDQALLVWCLEAHHLTLLN